VCSNASIDGVKLVCLPLIRRQIIIIKQFIEVFCGIYSLIELIFIQMIRSVRSTGVDEDELRFSLSEQ
jgi:hypothetical protein